MTLRLDADGAERVRSALSDAGLHAIAGLFSIGGRPGTRLTADDLRPIAALLQTDGEIGRVAAHHGGSAMRAVRAILLDKSAYVNWGLSWHQDRVIAVTERCEVPGFTGWSCKDGMLHVQAPAELMAGMLTLRIHVDPVDAGNAPLLILRGSHLLGRLREAEIDALAASAPKASCLAEQGDIWVYRTPVVHASEPQSAAGARRRVLQVDFADFALPGGLDWAYSAFQ